ncbi:putative acetyltransferase SH0499 [Artemia franciscana]|uniref:putative acetyltransferase SH0499 n=1 Tax=Artemia franciscana TaxID=6661 RepID=UPI0032DAEB57
MRVIPARLRTLMLKTAGAEIGQSTRILEGGYYYGDLSRLRIGSGVFINVAVDLFPTGGIHIGNNAAIGPRTLISTAHHSTTNADRRGGRQKFSPVTIGDGAWLGANVTVLGGVVIGEGAVIAAGSLVTRDCDPHTLYAGTPAKLVKRLDHSSDRAELTPSLHAVDELQDLPSVQGQRSAR